MRKLTVGDVIKVDGKTFEVTRVDGNWYQLITTKKYGTTRKGATVRYDHALLEASNAEIQGSH